MGTDLALSAQKTFGACKEPGTPEQLAAFEARRMLHFVDTVMPSGCEEHFQAYLTRAQFVCCLFRTGCCFSAQIRIADAETVAAHQMCCTSWPLYPRFLASSTISEGVLITAFRRSVASGADRTRDLRRATCNGHSGIFTSMPLKRKTFCSW